jgi:hypothetical protein
LLCLSIWHVDSEFNCVGYNYCYSYPGIPDLSQVGTGILNDAALSVVCNN